jgi:hypothetical protein
MERKGHMKFTLVGLLRRERLRVSREGSKSAG